MTNRRRADAAAVAAALAVLLLAASPAAATYIEPGYDLLRTIEAYVDLSPFGLPPNVPLGPFPPPWGPLWGDTDTVVERAQGIDPFPNPDGLGLIDIEIVTLSLTSIDPIDLSPLGGPFDGVFGDFYFFIDRDSILDIPQLNPLPPSRGEMGVRHLFPNGGEFDSCFGELGEPGHAGCAALGLPGGGIYADVFVTVAGGDLMNPLDVLLHMPAPRVALSSTNSLWSHSAPPLYPNVPGYPAGLFYPGIDPETGEIVGLNHVGPHPRTEPAQIPEPATLALLAFGGLVVFRRGSDVFKERGNLK